MKKIFFFLAALAVAFTANAKVTTISPDADNDALRLAVHYAEDGDIIEMTEGTYVQCNNNYVAFDGKAVTVRAAEGANVVLQLQVPITLANGGKATLENIKIDASRLQELSNYAHVIYADDATEGKQLVMDGCELYGFGLNKAAIYSSSSNTLALCDVKNCYFHDNMKSCFFFEGSSIAELSVVNSTFANIATNAESYSAGPIDVRNADAKVTIDHCTFYDCKAMSTDYATVTMKGPQAANVVISNNIFALSSDETAMRAIRNNVNAKNCLTFNYKYSSDSNPGLHSTVVPTDCQLNVDPKFVDAANGNFALADGSPALTAGTDGKAIGDPRWVSTEGGDDNTGDDNEDPEDQPEEGGVNIYVSTSGNDDNDGKTPETAKATLEKAYEVTNAGGTIVLAGGTYTTSDTITIDKAGITIKAEEDANVVLQPKAPIEIGNGGKLALQNIKMDASQLGSHKHAIEVTDATDGKELLMDGCELYGYTVVDAAIYVGAANTLKMCEVKNCYFHDNMKSCIFLEGAVSKFLLLNSTFANIATSSSEFISVVDVRNTTSFIANHCTFYNCQAINTDHAAIKVEGDALIANSVFVSPASQSSYRAVHAKEGWNVEAKNCLTFNYGASKNGIRSAATQTDCVVGDPLFVDAGNGDFAFAAGSPALASGTNGTNMGDLRWNPSDVNDGIVTDTPVEDNPGEEEEEEEEIIPNGKKLYLSTEGNNNNDGLTPATAKATFAKAVAAALDGDTIIVADGLYSEAYEIKFEKLGVVVMAAEGAKPVVQLTGQWTSIVLMATTTFDGITFDGAGIAYYLLSSKGTDAGTFTFKNCEFTNWDSYWAISNQYSDNTHVKSVVVDNCIFHNATGAAIHFNENGPRGAHACDNLTITNSTFYNLSVVEWVGIIQLDGNSGAKQPNNLTIDHITMYNYKTSELGGIVSDVKTNLTLTNSIIANPANVTQRYGYAYGTSTIDHNLLFNVTKDSGTHTNEIAGDPMFVFPDGGNFNLRPGSPALNAAADGKHLGDTRWGEAELVAVTGVELKPNAIHTFTTDTTKIEVVILPVEATNRNVTWAVADPAIVKLENGTLIALKPGETTVTVTTEDGGFTATATVVVEQKQFHPLVIEADNMYAAEDYTVPSYVQMLVAKEAARRDSSKVNVAALQAKIDALQPYQAPYDVVVNINGDPRTNMAFTWFTNETVTEGEVQLVAKADATEADFADAITVVATTTTTDPLPYAVDDSGILWKAKMDKDQAHTYSNHKAVATDLTPNTTYTYRVGTEGYWSELGTFITAPEKNNEFSFIYMSDAHIMTQDYVDDANSAARAALNTAPDAKFCAFPGDFVDNYCNSEWEWERLFEEALRPMAYQMPIVPTDGNHDVHYNPNYSYHFNTDNSFKTHASVKPYADGTTYSFMYGDVLFLVFSMQDYWRGTYSHNTLTSVYLQNDVANWFKDQVAAHPEAKLRVAMCHYNIFSGSSHQDDEMGALLRATMLPVMKECEIDFVIQGHDHCYEVMGPVDADTRKPILEDIADREEVPTSVSMSGYKGGTYTVDNGAMYFIGSTCGHKRYWPNSAEDMEEIYDLTKVDNYFSLFTGMFAQPDKPSFSVFTVNNRTITVDSYTANPDGTSEKFNTFVVKRTVAHTGETSGTPTNLEQLQDALNTNTTKVLHNGQVLIVREGVVYTLFGQQVK